MSHKAIHAKVLGYKLPIVLTTVHILCNCYISYMSTPNILCIFQYEGNTDEINMGLTFLWLTHFSSTSSLYARLACVWFWKGRHSFFTATGIPRTVSRAELITNCFQEEKDRYNGYNGGKKMHPTKQCWIVSNAVICASGKLLTKLQSKANNMEITPLAFLTPCA